MAPTRPLPQRFNPLMTEEVPPYETLIARRRLGQTDLSSKTGNAGSLNSAKSKNVGTFDYAHLRAPLPKGIVSGIFNPSPASYFLMRRSRDGYVSATGMFKATFPYATAMEEEHERKYIKSLDTTSADETAGNVWIPPQDALRLAEEYQILPWIRALLDNAPIDMNPTKDTTPKTIVPPPPFSVPQDSLGIPTSSRGRPKRSASPRKIAGTRTRKNRYEVKSEFVKSGSVESSVKPPGMEVELETIMVPTTDEKHQLNKEPGTPQDYMSKEELEVKEELELVEDLRMSKESEEKEDVIGPAAAGVDMKVVAGDDVETTRTHVVVELPARLPSPPSPEDTKAMITKAKEMVDAAVKKDSIVTSKKPKRKVQELAEADTAGAVESESVAKRPKFEATELKKERIKSRALLGITATLAIGAAVQYAFNAL